jgi:hypothetical protein
VKHNTVFSPAEGASASSLGREPVEDGGPRFPFFVVRAPAGRLPSFQSPRRGSETTKTKEGPRLRHPRARAPWQQADAPTRA